jgi:hypothetical protein
MVETEQEFRLPAEFNEIPSLPEKYLDEREIADFTIMEQAF